MPPPSDALQEQPPSPSQRGRPLRWLVAVALLAIVAWQLAKDPAPFEQLRKLEAELVLGLALLVALNQWLMAQRFSLTIQHCCGYRLGAWIGFRLVSVAQMLNLFVPQLGNVYRGVELKGRFGISYLTYASALLAFVWLDLVMGLLTAAVAVAVLEPAMRFAEFLAIPVLAAATLGTAAAPRLLTAALGRLRLRQNRLVRIRDKAASIVGAAGSMLDSPRLLWRYLALSLLVTAGQITTLCLAFDSVGASPSLAALLFIQIFLKLSNQLVVTPGNLGITEIVLGALAHGANCNVEQGMAASLLLRAVNTVAVMVFGMALGGGRLLVQRWRPAR